MLRFERLLAEGVIDDVQGIMRWGSNYAALVTIRDGGLAVTAVYKPQRGERPLWDFPDGTLCYREVVSYLISQALEWYLVPPTVLRHGPHGLGSLQLFIEHDPDINYFSLNDQFVPQLQRFVIFDDLINNADRKGGHLLLDARGKLWGIDHGLTLNAMPKLRTVIWEFSGLPVPHTLLVPVQGLLDQLAAGRKRDWLPFSKGGSEPWVRAVSVPGLRHAVGEPSILDIRRQRTRTGSIVIHLMYGETEETVPCEVFRNRLKLPSCPEVIRYDEGQDLWHFSGIGEGHGEGLSIARAAALANP